MELTAQKGKGDRGKSGGITTYKSNHYGVPLKNVDGHYLE